MLRISYLILFLFYVQLVVAQQPSNSLLNSLEYEELLTLFNDFDGDSLAQEKIARTYLDRARAEGDTVKVARGYDRLARIFHPQKNILYADSLIAYTKDWEHITYPGLGYMLKMFEYYRLSDVKKSYENSLKAYDYSLKNSNASQQAYLLDILFMIRLEWGNKLKSLNYQKRRHQIINSDGFIDEIKKSTRNSLHDSLQSLLRKEIIYSYKNFVSFYLLNNDYDKAEDYLDTLNTITKNLQTWNKDDIDLWVTDAYMEVHFFKKNYKAYKLFSDKLMQSFLNDNLNQYHIKNLFLFKGLYFKELKKTEEAIKFLKISDSLYDIDPNRSFKFYDELLFKNLAKLFENKKDFKNQIKYLDKLLYLDSISMVNYQFIEPEIIKTFDTPLLLEEKEAAILQLKRENSRSKSYLIFGGALLVLLLILSAFFYRQKVVFKKRFKALLQNANTESNTAGPTISETLVEDILKKLKQFEEKKQFRNPEVSLNYLAKKFGTNSTYLSKVLNVYKEKNLSQYLNDLRVSYAIKEIKENSNFRKYSIEAIAKECGYRNATSFSRAFYKKTGIYPSFFVSEWNKQFIEKPLS